MLIELLRKHEYEALHAVNGYEALALARREQPGLILLDLRMPGMDGYEALTRLKKDPETRGIPILVMSAHAADPVHERLKVQAMGAQDFLSKPFSLEELVSEIDRVLQYERVIGTGLREPALDDAGGPRSRVARVTVDPRVTRTIECLGITQVAQAAEAR